MGEPKKLGEMLCERKLVDEQLLKAALDLQRSTGDRLGSTLLKLDLVDPEMLASVLGEQHEVEGVDPSKVTPTPEASRLLTSEEAVTLGALPLWVERGTVAVALADPSDPGIIGKIEDLTGKTVKRLVAPQMALYRAIKRAYGDHDEERPGDHRLRRIAAGLRQLASELETYIAEQDVAEE
jgi:MSHA biogenesis protein MshE